MADDKYLLQGKGQGMARQLASVLFGVPTVGAFGVVGYMGATSSVSFGGLLFVGYAIWMVLFIMTAQGIAAVDITPGGQRDPEAAAQASGMRGESTVRRWLSELPADYILFDGVRLPHAQSQTGERELDFVVIGKRRVFVVEVKNNAGTIAPVNLWDKQWLVTTPSGGERSMRNPLHQVYGQTKTLEERLAERGVYVEAQPIVVLSNSDCAFICNDRTSIPIAKSGSVLRALITRLDEQGRELGSRRVAEVLASVDHARRPA